MDDKFFIRHRYAGQEIIRGFEAYLVVVAKHKTPLVGEHVGIAGDGQLAILERRFERRHIFAVPLQGEHHLGDAGGAVSLRGHLGQVLAVAARVHRAGAEARKSVEDVKQDLLLLLERDVAQLDDKRRDQVEQLGLHQRNET